MRGQDDMTKTDILSDDDVREQFVAGAMLTGMLRDRLARAIAVAQDADYFFDEIERWEQAEEWEREAYPGEYPSMAYEDREYYRKVADAVLAELSGPARDSMVAAGVRAVNGLDWTQTEFGEVPHERDIARALNEQAEKAKGGGDQ